MEMTNEEIVTNMLQNREILKRNEVSEAMESVNYATNPQYDLSMYMKTAKPEIGRFGPRYIFVK